MSKIWTMGEILVEIMRPRPGIELYEKAEFTGPYPSGAPAIFIDTVARLGHEAAIIGGVGIDDFGKSLIDRLTRDGVDCSHVLSVPGRSTAVAFVTYFNDGSRKFIFHIDSTPAAMAKAPDISEINDPSFFHIMGCSLMINKDFYYEIIKGAERFRKKGAKISFDPNIRPELLGSQNIHEIVEPVLKNCSVLLPGVEELLFITGKTSVNSALKFVFDHGIEIVVLKKGSKGCTIYTPEEEISLGVYKIDMVDPTGAGDCFDAAFLCGIIEGRSLKDAALRATAVAALNTSAFGPMEGEINIEAVESTLQKELIYE